MAFANSAVTDIIATTIESRTGEIADNVTNNNALLFKLQQKGKVKPFSGGSQIDEELSFAQNGNASWYSGYDLLSVAAQDVISASTWSIKQIACPVVISGLEKLQNAGKEKIIDLIDARLEVAEATMANLMAQGIYSDGTTYGGKSLVGLQAMVIETPSSGALGGINPAVWSFWQNQVTNVGGTATATTIQPFMDLAYAKAVRGKDHPDLVVFDNALWATYMASLQANQRFTDAKMADAGFTTVKYMNSDVVLDGGLGGYAPSGAGYFLNTNYIHLRPHSDRNMVPLNPDRRVSINQDAEVSILAWAGAFTLSNRSLQGYFRNS